MGSTDRPVLDEGNIYDGEQQSERNTGFGDLKNVSPLKKRNSGLPFGKDMLDNIMSEIKNGLPADLRSRIENQGTGAISGNLKSGEEKMRRTFASEGDVPIGARTDAMSNLNKNANKSLNDLYTNIGDMDYKAMQNAYGKYGDLIRLAMGKANSTNDARLKSYQIESEGDFSWGDAIGGLLGAGGQIGGAILSKP